MIKVAVLLEKCDEGGFAASVPTLPGCFSEGETVEEALANIAEAIELHLEPVEDDLIVDDEILVKELIWDRARPNQQPTEGQPRAASDPGSSPEIHPSGLHAAGLTLDQ